MKKKTKIIFLSLIYLCFLFLIIVPVCGENTDEDTRTLEIVYPKIPGVSAPKVISSGLPEYIKYVFYFAFSIIGLIAFGAIVYNGFQYLTSAGNTEKLSEAKKGLFSAFLGAAILFSATIIFNTINPQITVLELPDSDIIEAVVPSGIYLCNKQVPNIHDLIETYENGSQEESIEAVKKLSDIMNNKEGSCYRVNFSGNLEFIFQTKNTMFMIPRKEYVYVQATETQPAETRIDWKYDYGIIFHEEDNFKGKCRLSKRIYKLNATGSTGENFDKVRSITIFKESETEPDPNREGVILYQCMDYGALCPNNITKGGLKSPLPLTGATLTRFTYKVLAEAEFAENTRSIIIDPEGTYFAIMFSEDNFKGEKCEVIGRSDNNLLSNYIGRCGPDCSFSWLLKETKETQLRRCIPCLKSLLIVKGAIIY